MVDVLGPSGGRKGQPGLAHRQCWARVTGAVKQDRCPLIRVGGVDLDRDAALAHEDGVLEYATARVREIPGARIIGEARHKTGVLSFLLEGVHPHDAGTILDREGVAVRTGQHCAQPVMDRYGITATIRASLGIYNTREDIDALVRALGRVREVFA